MATGRAVKSCCPVLGVAPGRLGGCPPGRPGVAPGLGDRAARGGADTAVPTGGEPAGIAARRSGPRRCAPYCRTWRAPAQQHQTRGAGTAPGPAAAPRASMPRPAARPHGPDPRLHPQRRRLAGRMRGAARHGEIMSPQVVLNRPVNLAAGFGALQPNNTLDVRVKGANPSGVSLTHSRGAACPRSTPRGTPFKPPGGSCPAAVQGAPSGGVSRRNPRSPLARRGANRLWKGAPGLRATRLARICGRATPSRGGRRTDGARPPGAPRRKVQVS